MKFLVKEIISRTGEVHFRRWRFLELPWLRIYLHQILKADEDGAEHSHPWHFVSWILRGRYVERSNGKLTVRTPFWNPLSFRNRRRYHMLHEVTKPTWTLVLAFGSGSDWGYATSNGHVDHKTFRERKVRQ